MWVNPFDTQTWADLHTWKFEAWNRRLTFLSSKTWISNVKYFFRFLTIKTKNGSFIPSVAAGSAGHVMYVDWIFDPIISSTLDCMSSSCSRLMWPSTTINKVPDKISHKIFTLKLKKIVTIIKQITNMTKTKMYGSINQ